MSSHPRETSDRPAGSGSPRGEAKRPPWPVSEDNRPTAAKADPDRVYRCLRAAADAITVTIVAVVIFQLEN